MEENNQEEKCVDDKIKEMVDQKIQEFTTAEINANNLHSLYELVDIKKDYENIDYWKIKKEVLKMRYYDGYDEGDYGRRMRDSRGRYMEGNYSRRGVPGTGRGRYRGEEMLDDMRDSYDDYNESRDAYNRGNYGAENEKMKSLEYMLKSVKQFMRMLSEDAESQEEMKMIQKTAREIGEM
jgi:hypothetical protein